MTAALVVKIKAMEFSILPQSCYASQVMLLATQLTTMSQQSLENLSIYRIGIVK